MTDLFLNMYWIKLPLLRTIWQQSTKHFTGLELIPLPLEQAKLWKNQLCLLKEYRIKLTIDNKTAWQNVIKDSTP